MIPWATHSFIFSPCGGFRILLGSTSHYLIQVCTKFIPSCKQAPSHQGNHYFKKCSVPVMVRIFILRPSFFSPLISFSDSKGCSPPPQAPSQEICAPIHPPLSRLARRGRHRSCRRQSRRRCASYARRDPEGRDPPRRWPRKQG